METADAWQDVDVLFPCCGSMTSERVLSSTWPDRFQLHSSDVNIVSSALGAAAAGGKLPVTVTAECQERAGWLEEWMTEGVDVAATLWLAFRYVVHLARDGWVHDRYLGGLKEQWPRMFAETRGRMLEALPHLTSYTPADAVDWLRARPGLPVITYPPFRNAESSYFTGDWKLMGKLFEWDEPPYEVLDDDRYQGFLDDVTSRDCWLLGLNEPRPELADKLVLQFKPTNRAPTINVYASNGKLRMVRPRQEVAGVPWPHLLPGQELGERIALAPISFPEFCGVRSMYMNKGIRPGSPDMSVAVLVDEVFVGCFALMRQAKGVSLKAPWASRNVAYLMSDFPVAASDYPRLSKLIVAAALSEDARLLAERTLRRRFDTVLTTAFTNNPVSMKYRGEMQLYSRKEQDFKAQLEGWVQDQVPDWNSYYRRKFDLNYIATWGDRSLEEAYATWQRKHGERRGSRGSLPATTDR
jgi:hypothetical protein